MSKKNMKYLSIIIVIFSLIGGILGSQISSLIFSDEEIKSSQIINMSDVEEKITKIVEETSPSVVSIVIKKDLTVFRSDPWGFFRRPVGSVKRKVGGGTAFFITENGLLLTNKHVVNEKNAEYTVITNNNTEYDAKVVWFHPSTDLALIQIQSEETFIPLSFVQKSETVKIGQFAIAIGNALAEFQNTVSLGVVSGKNRDIQAGGEILNGLLQTDTAINPGNSGGPLVNLHGEVIGVNTAIIDNSNGIGFSIPLSQKDIQDILDSIY